METGGSGGHSAIVARGMEIPAVVGIGPFLQLLRSNDSIIVDGHLGESSSIPMTRHSNAIKLVGNTVNRLLEN